ncbi:MAG: M15 family metallopeptidase [Caldilineaceae bacterium]
MSNEAENAARRSYWTAKMDEAFAFMGKIRQYPVNECGEPVVSLVDAASAAGVEVAFSDRPHVQGLPRLYWLRAGLIDSFIRCAREMNERGWILKVEDAFRTVTMQKFLARAPHTFDYIVERVFWECNGAQPPVDLLARRVAALVAAAPKVGTHMSGSAIDISVLDRATGQEIDRGRPYLEMSELTPMDSPFISAEAAANRAEITALMGKHGFVTYPWEFWHYNQGDAYDQYLNQTGKAAQYGAVHISLSNGNVQPIEAPLTSLNSSEEMESEMRQALERRNQRMDQA